MTAIVFSLLMKAASAEDRVFGAPLLPGAREENEVGRYSALRTYEDVVEFYEKLFKGSNKVRWRKIVNQPQVKATHLQNLSPTAGGWSGINIYEVNGQTHLYVLRVEPKKKSSQSSPG